MKKILAIFLVLFFSFNSLKVFASSLEEQYDVSNSKEYDEISELKYSPDWKNISFIAKKNWKYFIVKNWIEWEKYDIIYDSKYSEDWKHFTFLVIKNSKIVLIKDWVETKENYEELNNISKDNPINKSYDIEKNSYKKSIDWKSYGFIAKKDWKYFLVKDWIESKKYNIISDFHFSPDWNSYYFLAIDNWKVFWTPYWAGIILDNWEVVPYDYVKNTLVKDWVEINKYDHIYNPIYSPNWKSFSFIAKKDWKEFLVKDWIESSKYDWDIKRYNNELVIQYSPDSSSYVFLAQKDWKKIIVKDWKESNKYNTIYDFEYSPNSKSYAFVATKDNRNRVLVKDWVESKEYSENQGYSNFPFFWYSPNGKNFIYIVIKSWKWILVKDWVESKEYNEIKKFDTENSNIYKYVLYSPDNKNYFFVWKRDWKEILVKNWTENLNYDYYWNRMGTYNWRSNLIYFSPYNSANFTYVAEKNKKKILVKDWLEIDKYGTIFDFKYSPDNKSFSFIAQNKELLKYYIVQYKSKENSKVPLNSNISINKADFKFTKPNSQAFFITYDNQVTISWEVPKTTVKKVTINSNIIDNFNWTIWEYTAKKENNTLKKWINVYEIKYYWDSGKILHTNKFIIVSKEKK